MDPLSILTIATAVVQFLDFAFKLLSPIQTRVGGKNAKATPFQQKAIITDFVQRCKNLKIASEQCEHGENPDHHLRAICDESIAIADKLIAALDEFNLPRGRDSANTSSRWTIFRQIVSRRLSDRDISAMSAQLSGLREQIKFDIIDNLRQELSHRRERDTQALVQQLAVNPPTNLRSDPEKTFLGKNFLDGLDKDLQSQWKKELVNAVYDGRSSSAQSINHVRVPSLKEFVRNSREMHIAEQFRKTLDYEHRKCRHDKIETALTHTFKWLFEPDEETSTSWDFVHWLRDNAVDSGSNIFWMTGKPGSGKSTLIKYIFDDIRTKLHLLQWSQQSNLVIAAYFFWAAPSEEKTLVNSHEGLFRSLLYQIFELKPNLIQFACHQRWEVCSLFGMDPREWTLDELVRTMQFVLEHSNDKFFFLIDGLDEFYGDHDQLLDHIETITKHSKVKVCTASRPWSVFEDKFGRSASLTLNELTNSDIKYYAETRLSSSQGFLTLRKAKPDDAKSLVESIAIKSDGVFLWVRIVVQGLIEELRDGIEESDPKTMLEMLEKLPQELEALFHKILSGLKSSHERDASILFQLVKESYSPIDLFTLSLAGQPNSSVAIQQPVGPMSDSDRLWQCSNMRRRLNSRTKGLLELVPDVSDNMEQVMSPEALSSHVRKLSSCRVQHMHRTVRDFLNKPKVWEEVRGWGPQGFNPYDSLARGALIHLKILPMQTLTRRKLWLKVYQVLHYAGKAEVFNGRALVDILKELDRVGEVLGAPFVEKHISGLTRLKPKHNPHWTATQQSSARDYSFVCLAVQYGLVKYVEVVLSENPRLVIQPSRSRALLDCAILEPKQLSDFSKEQLPPTWHAEMFPVLFAAGADPNRVDYLSRTPWSYVLERTKNEYKAMDRRTQQGLVVERERVDEWVELIELFLKHGADCWTRLDAATGGALRKFDKKRAKELERLERRGRGSLKQLKQLLRRT